MIDDWWGVYEDDGGNEGGEDLKTMEGTKVGENLKVGRIRGRGGNEGGRRE